MQSYYKNVIIVFRCLFFNAYYDIWLRKPPIRKAVILFFK